MAYLKALLAAFLLTWSCSLAFSQQSQSPPFKAARLDILCTPNRHDFLLDPSWLKYKETPVASGISKSGQLFEVYAADNGSTFTVMLTDPDTKMVCLIGAGTDLTILRSLLGSAPL